MDWKEKIRDLSTSLNNFGSLKNQQTGAGRPPPFVGFWLLPKFFEHLLKSRIFSFQSILACRGSQKLLFGDLGLTCKLRGFVALRGEKSKKNWYLRIQGRMQIFEQMSQCFKSRYDTVEREISTRAFDPAEKTIDLHNDSNVLMTKQWTNIISVPMSYISLWEYPKVVPQGPFGRIKLYFEPDKRPAGAFWADKSVFWARSPAGDFWAEQNLQSD